jgi:hypothetical protein
VYTLDPILTVIDFGQQSAFHPRGASVWLAYALIATGLLLMITLPRPEHAGRAAPEPGPTAAQPRLKPFKDLEPTMPKSFTDLSWKRSHGMLSPLSGSPHRPISISRSQSVSPPARCMVTPACQHGVRAVRLSVLPPKGAA